MVELTINPVDGSYAGLPPAHAVGSGGVPGRMLIQFGPPHGPVVVGTNVGTVMVPLNGSNAVFRAVMASPIPVRMLVDRPGSMYTEMVLGAMCTTGPVDVFLFQTGRQLSA